IISLTSHYCTRYFYHTVHSPSHSISCFFFFSANADPRALHSFPTRRSSDLPPDPESPPHHPTATRRRYGVSRRSSTPARRSQARSEEHTSELQSQSNLVCRLLLEKKK